MEKPEILLDVPLEDLLDILTDDGWVVDTVTKKLGSTKEDPPLVQLVSIAWSAQSDTSTGITLSRALVKAKECHSVRPYSVKFCCDTTELAGITITSGKFDKLFRINSGYQKSEHIRI